MRVCVRGTTYESVAEAAKALGVAKKTVYTAIRNGREDFIGLGVGTPMPVVIRGVEYGSVTAAAAALGVHPTTITTAIAKGRGDRCGLGRRQPRIRPGGGLPKKEVNVGGIRFPSIAALARFIGRDPRNVRTSLRAGDLARARVAMAVMKVIAKRESNEAKKRLREQSAQHMETDNAYQGNGTRHGARRNHGNLIAGAGTI